MLFVVIMLNGPLQFLSVILFNSSQCYDDRRWIFSTDYGRENFLSCKYDVDYFETASFERLFLQF